MTLKQSSAVHIQAFFATAGVPLFLSVERRPPSGLRPTGIINAHFFGTFLPETTGMFQLWWHDNIGFEPHGSGNATPYATPDTDGQRCTLRFTAWSNTHLRIHLQYKPGEGQIEVSDVKIAEIKMP